MLNLGGLNDLARALGVPRTFLDGVLDDFDASPESLVKELTLWPADPTKKPRDVICVRKKWRLLQERIYGKLLLPWFKPLRCCHGGVRGRSPATNARMHLGNTHVFLADISNFFPSIRCGRVNKLFLSKACSYKAAGALTRLCTYRHHLALGLVTSPIIANELLRPIDEEMERFCQRNRLSYSRFIDDVTISGKFDLKKCHVEESLTQTLNRHQFEVAKGKTHHGRLDVAPVADRKGEDQKQLAITGVRIKGNHLDASRDFAEKLDRILADHSSLAEDGPFDGPLFMEGEVLGKIYYACSLNPGRKRAALSRIRDIDWGKVMAHAADRGLLRSAKRLTPRGDPKPDCTMPLPLAAGKEYVRQYYAQNSYDPAETPFDVADAAVNG